MAGHGEIVFMNGAYIPVDQAKVSVFDHGFLFGDGCFETMLVCNGRPFRSEDHLDRLYRSASVLRIPIAVSRDALARAILETVSRNGFRDAYVRVVLTRGVGYAALDPRLCETPTLVIFAYESSHHPFSRTDGKQRGIRCIISSVRRTPSGSLPPQIKSTNYLNLILARFEAIAAGADEAILLDVHDYVAEASGRNVFIVRSGALFTPRPLHILVGITRQVAMELAERDGLAVHEADFTSYDLYTADEVFTTSTAGGIIPIVQIDGRPIADESVGPVTARLMQQYGELVAGDHP